MLSAIDHVRRHAAVAGTAALILLTASAVPGTAAAAGDAAMQLAQARGPAAGNAPSAGAPQSPTAEVDRKIADLKRQLKITPQQEPQFDAFAQVMRGNAQELDQAMRQAPSGPPNAVEELRRFAQFTETQANGLKRLVPALQSLYDTLSDPQKKTADQLLAGGEETGGAPGGPPPPQRGR